MAKSLDQIYEQILREQTLRAEKKTADQARSEAEAARRREAARQDYLKQLRINEAAAAQTPTSSSSAAGGTPCLQYTTHTNTAYLYPQSVLDHVLAGTTYSFTRNGDDIIVADLTDFIGLYLEVVDWSLQVQPVGNPGYTLGVGTKLRARRNAKTLNWIIGDRVTVKWVLVTQVTRQSDLPFGVGGSSPDGTIGYTTTFTDYPAPYGNTSGTQPHPYLDVDFVNEGPCI
jgi:hypothetical protein